MSATTAIGIWEESEQELGAAPALNTLVRPDAGHGADGQLLARYRRTGRRARELVVLSAHAGSRLVVDRLVDTGEDARLIGHLAPDEPQVNADILCREYLRNPSPSSCRALHQADRSRLAPWMLPELGVADPAHPGDGTAPFALTVITTDERTELRWSRSSGSAGEPTTAVSLRHVIGVLESYEPARSLTTTAVIRHRSNPSLSVATLAAELHRLATSSIVLNRLLRQAVERAVDEGMSLSVIAMRCSRVKRDARGNVSGETSWLGRRIGLLPEGGGIRPTPWIHSDVLALIARRGLGITPREVELG